MRKFFIFGSILFLLYLGYLHYSNLPGMAPIIPNKGNKAVQLYIDRYAPYASQEMLRSGVPASIKLAQGILESQYGVSELARKANNHFGIKCGSEWKGDRYCTYSNEWNSKRKKMEPRMACFRWYPSVHSCFQAHSDFLAKRERYAPLFKLEKTDYKGWAKGLQSTGYATDPNYAEKLISLIERFELYQYDFKFSVPPIPFFNNK